MVQRPRQRVGRDYSETFQFAESAESPDVSRMLEAAWFGPGNEQGGDALDDLLNGLGQAIVEAGRVKWTAPSRLDVSLREYLSQSVDELNRRLDSGELQLDEDGNIRPANDD